MVRIRPVTRWLETASPLAFSLYAVTAAFSVYFCMYAFRKPFTAGLFTGEMVPGTEFALKTAFVLSQVLGYTLSKFIGIKICSEARREQLPWLLMGTILLAESALILFALGPTWLRIAAMFLNGLPLGMVWGLVVWYLEGRRTSEILMAGLACSFIVSSGAVKDVGRWLIASGGVSEWWMPAATGGLFLFPFALAVLMLHQLPSPSEDDIAARSQRIAMRDTDRWAFVRAYWPGLFLIVAVYFFVTAYRDIRDNYGIEVLVALGMGERQGIFSQTETLVGLGVTLAMAGLYAIEDNRRALLATFIVMTAGMVLLGVGTILFDRGHVDGFTWFVLTGLGIYLTYVPYNAILFERIIASTRAAANAVFAIYIADACGYTGSAIIQFYNVFGNTSHEWYAFMHQFTYGLSLIGSLTLVAGGWYFLGPAQPRPTLPTSGILPHPANIQPGG